MHLCPAQNRSRLKSPCSAAKPPSAKFPCVSFLLQKNLHSNNAKQSSCPLLIVSSFPAVIYGNPLQKLAFHFSLPFLHLRLSLKSWIPKLLKFPAGTGSSRIILS